MVTTRFAPSPTGFLHLGHAFSAWTAHSRARAAGGQFLLRLEDIDTTRCRPEYHQAIIDDLTWLGLTWDGPVRVQSEHLPDYQTALKKLEPYLYPCFCSRAEILRRAQSAPHGAETIYPGTCRNLSATEAAGKIAAGAPYALRLNTTLAVQTTGALRFFEEADGWVDAQPAQFGDVILARWEISTSYHLCVVHDDAEQKITHVIRGEDLRDSTHIHVLLQALLNLPTPIYAHHRLLHDAQGHRLAKRANAPTLKSMREAGVSAESVLKRFHQSEAQ
jgi:glutamyl-Q tRNA(Asp) synthetase